MTIACWRPTGMLGDLTRWGETLDRLFDEVRPTDWERFFPVRGWAPAVDIYEEDNAIVLKAEVPGLTKDEITIEVHDGTLTIKGEKHEEKEEKTKLFHRAERTYGAFQRSFRLPETVDADAIKANFRNGLLELSLPKIEKKVPEAKKIEVLTE